MKKELEKLLEIWKDGMEFALIWDQKDVVETYRKCIYQLKYILENKEKFDEMFGIENEM